MRRISVQMQEINLKISINCSIYIFTATFLKLFIRKDIESLINTFDYFTHKVSLTRFVPNPSSKDIFTKILS